VENEVESRIIGNSELALLAVEFLNESVDGEVEMRWNLISTSSTSFSTSFSTSTGEMLYGEADKIAERFLHPLHGCSEEEQVYESWDPCSSCT